MAYTFEPRYGLEEIRQHLENYKVNPSMYSQQQVAGLKQHAIYYRVPFAEDEQSHDFNILNAIKQFGEGYLSGFTTLNIGEASNNPIEKVFRSIGSLAGFVGYLPGLPAKMVAKLGISSASHFARILTGANALSKAGVSVPMTVSRLLTNKAKKTVGTAAASIMAGRSAAMKTAVGFLSKEIPSSIMQQAFHLGTASAVSSWSHGVDEMVKSFAGGAVTGGVFGALGNAIGLGGLYDPKNEVVRRTLNTITHSLYTGLPSTMRGDTTPEQVYEYLLGAYFGMGAHPSSVKAANEFFDLHTKDHFSNKPKNGMIIKPPEEYLEFNNMSVGAKQLAKKMIYDYHAPRVANTLVMDLAEKFNIPVKEVVGIYGNDINDIVKKQFKSPIEETKPLDQEMTDNFRISINSIIGKYSTEMKEMAVSKSMVDPGEFGTPESPSNSIKKFIQKNFIETGVFNPANEKHNNIYSKISDAWDKFQPITSEKNNSEKMVKWLYSQKDFELPNTPAERKEIERFWKLRASEKIHYKKQQLYGVDVNTGYVNKVSNDRAIDGSFRVDLRTPEQLDGIIKKLYSDAGIELKSPPIAIVDHGVTQVESEYFEKGVKKTSIRNLIVGISKQMLPDSAKTKMFEYFNLLGKYYHSGISDKEKYKFVDYHPEILKLNTPEALGNKFKETVEALASSFAKNPGDVSVAINEINAAEKRFLEHYKGNKSLGIEIYRKSFLSNILYDMARNGMNLNTKEFLSKIYDNDADFIRTLKAFNKREQIVSTDSIPVDKNFVKNKTGKEKLNYIILEDINAKDIDVNSVATQYKAVSDGVIFVLPEYLKAFNESIGLPSEGNMAKPFVNSPDPILGGLLGKAFMFTPPQELMDYMSKNDLQVIFMKSAAKQIGFRRTYEYGKIGTKKYSSSENTGLIKEARKYKSAEEFVAEKIKNYRFGKNNIIQYTTPDIELKSIPEQDGSEYFYRGYKRSKDINYEMKSGIIKDVSMEGGGVYFTKDYSQALRYANRNKDNVILIKIDKKTLTDKAYGVGDDPDTFFINGDFKPISIEIAKPVAETPEQQLTDIWNNANTGLMYQLPVEHIGLVSTKTVDNHYLESSHVISQMFDQLMPLSHVPMDRQTIREFVDQTLSRSVNGSASWNERLSRFITNGGDQKERLAILKNIDNIGLNELMSAIHNKQNKEFATEILHSLFNLGNKTVGIDVASLEMSQMRGNEIINQGAKFSSAADKLLSSADPSLFSFLDPNVSSKYATSVINGYLKSRLTKPMVDNSMQAIMRPYTLFDANNKNLRDLNTNDSIFYLGNKFGSKVLYDSRLPKGKIKLIDAWKHRNNKKLSSEARAAISEIIDNVLVARAPIENASGVQKLSFAGFSGYEDYGIILHGKTMEALAGADLDGDSAFIYFSGEKGIQKKVMDLYAAQKEEYYVKEGNRTFMRNADSIDPETGKTYLSEKTITGGDIKNIMNNPLLKYDPYGRMIASEQAFTGRAQLGQVVNNRAFTLAGYNELMNKPESQRYYEYRYISPINNAVYDVIQRPKVDGDAKSGYTLNRIHKSTAASSKAAIDPMDFDGILPAKEMINIDLDTAFEFEVKTENGRSIPSSEIPVELKMSGVTSLFSKFKQALGGQNQTEGRAFTQLERIVAAERLSAEFPDAVTSMPMVADMSSSVDISDSLFRRVTPQEIDRIYQHNYNMNTGGTFDRINEFVGSISKNKKWAHKKMMPVKKHDIIASYIKNDLSNPVKKIEFIESNSALAKEIMLSSWYKKLTSKIPELTTYDEFKNMNVSRRADALRKIDIVAEEYLNNDIKDMSSMLFLTNMSANMKKTSIQKVWEASLRVKAINESGYKKNGKKLSRADVIIESDKMAIDIKKTFTEKESELFDAFMLSPMRGNGVTLTTRQAMDMQTTNIGVIKAFYGIQDKLFEEIISGVDTKVAAESTSDLIDVQNNIGKIIEESNPASFSIESREEMLKGLKLDKTERVEIKGKAKEIQQRILSFMDRYPGTSIEHINGWNIAINGKSLNASTMADLEVLANNLDDVRSGGGKFIAKILDDSVKKNPELKKLYTYLFPKRIGEKLMEFGLVFDKELAPYVDKNGVTHMNGTGYTPSNTIIRNQKYIDFSERMHTKLEQQINLAFSRLINPLMESEHAHEIWKAMVATKIENGMIKILKNPSHIASYKMNIDKYEKYIKSLGDMKHPVKRMDGTPAMLTTNELMTEMHRAHKNYVRTVRKWMVGNPKYIDKYAIKNRLTKNGVSIDARMKWIEISAKGLDANGWYDSMLADGWKPDGSVAEHYKGMPIYNYKQFIKNEIDTKQMMESQISLEIGGYGFKKIQHSMLLSTNKHRDKEVYDQLVKSGKKMVVVPGDLGEFFHPHNGYDSVVFRKALDSYVSAIESRTDLTREQKNKEILNLSHYGNLELLDAIKSTESDELWSALGPEIRDKYLSKKDKEIEYKWWEKFNSTGHEKKRLSHIPGWDLSPDALISYGISEAKQLMRNVAQLGARNEINDFYYRGQKNGLDELTNIEFVDFFRIQANSMMGMPQIIPKRILENPKMKISGTLFSAWADNSIVNKFNKIGEKLGLIKPEPDNIADVNALEARLKAWRLDENKLRQFANLEAKYQMAALLAHPKVSVNNIYGGTHLTIMSTGVKNYLKANSISEMQKLNPEWDSWEKVNKFIVQSGVIEEFMLHQAGVSPLRNNVKFKNFTKEVVDVLSKNPDTPNKTLRDLAKKHKLGEEIIDKAAWFMKVSERKLRRDAFLSHLIQQHNNWDGVLPYDHPFLIKSALNGVKATQFLYSSAFRPMFANTAIGKIATRFQLWAWNSVRARNDLTKKASLYGYKPGTESFERFKRMATMDILAIGLANAFAYSLFESSLPAPYSWMQDMADLVFGDEKERERAFFGAYPGAFAPLQLITPSALRLVGPTISALVQDDFSKLSSYHIWSAFPFGRITRDLVGPDNIFVNPSGIIEKTTGLPYRGVINYARKLKEENNNG